MDSVAGSEKADMRQERQQSHESHESRESMARRYAWLLGATAGLFTLIATLVNASLALAVQAPVVALQRSLAGISAGNGLSIDAFAGRITGALALAALIGLIALGIVLGFCWYAGRIAGALAGDPRAGASAGRRVALVSGLVWLAGSLVAVLAFHADASISWLLATLGVILASPDSATLSGYAVNAAAGSFLAVQLVILLLLQGSGILIALGLGALAGRAGAFGAARHIPAAPPGWHPPASGRPYAYPAGYWPPQPPPAWYPPYPGHPAYAPPQFPQSPQPLQPPQSPPPTMPSPRGHPADPATADTPAVDAPPSGDPAAN